MNRLIIAREQICIISTVKLMLVLCSTVECVLVNIPWALEKSMFFNISVWSILQMSIRLICCSVFLLLFISPYFLAS